ncbi:MAG: CapA family protein [Kofleriaceae bacterium]|nr:CapA family protein [Kofleriaceae bacterium]
MSRKSLLALLVALSLPAAGSAQAKPKPPGPPASLEIVVVGDVMLNRSNLPVRPDGVLEGRSALPWAQMSSKIRHLIDGDLNFMNLETVVTERNDLKPGDKRQTTPFLFRTHPKAVEHLLDIGFNLVSAANNHAYDYGEEGAKETISHLQRLTEAKPGTVYSGIGLNDQEAGRPATTWVRGLKVAFSSIGIVTNMLTFHRAKPNKAGTLGFRHKVDWENSLSQLEGADAGLKLLSVHYGVEREIRTDDRQRTEFRKAVGTRGADMVIGHHAHVVRGIELHQGKLIFYGLGNFLIRGAANMGKKPSMRTCCDFGLLAKVHMMRSGNEYKVAAVEAVPIFDMHRIPRVLSPQESGKRIEVLNVLAEALDNPKVGSVGVRFAIQPDGRGLYCSPDAASATASIRKLCSGYSGPSPVSAEVRRRVKAAPDPKKAKNKAKAKAKSKKAAQRKRKRAKARRRRNKR